jgi:lipopolysaccharide transport system ATP-binding protein
MAPVLKAEELSKYYKLGAINSGVLWKDLQSYIARLRGVDDPNVRIGQEGVYDRDGFWALSGINLDIEQGDRVGIMGKNGAGKSTLLKILSRITTPTKGCFHVKGRITSLLEVGTGFHNELTGRENIYMNGSILGMKRREITRRLDEIIEFSEIGPHIDTPVKRYSSGMYIRLGFAIAAHMECEIILADEVLAVGDLNFQQKAIGKMSDLSTSRGRTVLFVSHNTGAVGSLCNKGVVIDHGRIIREQCPVAEAIEKYKEIAGIN